MALRGASKEGELLPRVHGATATVRQKAREEELLWEGTLIRWRVLAKEPEVLAMAKVLGGAPVRGLDRKIALQVQREYLKHL